VQQHSYKEYKRLNPNPLFFFDTRISENMLATEADIEMRTENRFQDMPLQLVFSGRLINMKGADQLLEVARELKQLKVKIAFPCLSKPSFSRAFCN